MSALRLIGLASGLLLLAFVAWQRRNGRLTRGYVLLGALISASLAVVSAYPPVVDGLTEVFRVPTRLMALAIFGNIILFCLLLYLFKDLSEVRRSMGDLVRALARADYEKAHGDQAPSDVTIVIPAFDEESNLKALLPQLPTEICGRSVRALVIVDGTVDDSVGVVNDRLVPVTSHAINRGQGDSLKTGFELAIREGADIVVTMDADGQHRPEEIERLVAPILADEADFVMGTRFRGEYADKGGSRHFGIVVFSAFISMLLGRTRITDCTNGFRAIRASGLARLELHERQFSAPELIIEAVNKGLRMKEVPVTVQARQKGSSKKPPSWRYPLGFASVIVRTWLRS